MSNELDRNDFVQQLITALQVNERRAEIDANDDATLLHQTYRQLLFDYPHAPTERGLGLLSEALIHQDNPYRLSNPLLKGLQYLYETETTTATNTTADSSTGASSASTLSSALSWVHVSIHILIPWHILCHVSTIDQANAILGSYTANPHDPAMENRTINDHANPPPGIHEGQIDAAAQEHDANQPPANGSADHHNGNDDDDEHDSLAEIFADESDDDDFAYESERFSNHHQLEQADHETTIANTRDPLSISQPPSDRSWNNVADCLYELVSNLSASKLYQLNKKSDWQQHDVLEKLTQVIVALFATDESRTLFWNYFSKDAWQKQGLRIVDVYRDVTLRKPTLLLEPFLDTCRILLTMTPMTTTSTSVVVAQRNSATTPIEPATYVGLSSLSCLALEFQNNTDHVNTIQNSILDVCDELTLVLEARGSDDALLWTVVPLFQCLSKCADSSKARASSTSTNKMGQTLLQSGLFRQWLLCWKETSNCKEILQDSLWDLCATAPAVLGKYTWRFMDFANCATTIEEDSTLNNVTTPSALRPLLWNLLGLHLATISTTGVSRVQWKNPKSSATQAAAAVDIEACRSNGRKAFEKLFGNALRVVTDWKVRRQNGLEFGSTETQKPLLDDFSILASKIQMPLIRALLHEHFDLRKIREELRVLQHALLQWPTAPLEPEGKQDECQQLDGRREFTELPTINALRKSLKTLQSALDPTTPFGTAESRYFSSKAD